MQIYLDYSATTPPRPEVIDKIQETLTNQWGNPSSLHDWGNRSATILETARMEVADLINASNPDSIVFTSGGTEADNLAILGITQQYTSPQHLIISSVEHSAIAEPVKFLEQQGWDVTRLRVNSQGRVDPLELQSSIRHNTVLISIIYGQSEIGTLQPIERLGQIARENKILFHTDGVQVAGRIPLDVQKLPVDLLSLSSHKIYGMQGAGALYIADGLPILPLLRGGGQERQLRSGTQAIPAIAGFGVAAQLAKKELKNESIRLMALRDRLFDLLSPCPYLIPTGDRLHRLPHHVSFCLTNLPPKTEITGKTLVRQLNLAGIGISAGAACHSGKLSPSPILLAMGYSPSEALGGIRLTLGKHTTMVDLEWSAMVIQQILERLIPKLAVIR
jgi:cysteine desulfurase